MGVFPASLSETAVASAAFLECPIPLWNDLDFPDSSQITGIRKLTCVNKAECIGEYFSLVSLAQRFRHIPSV
jgi:hypothetical protein